MTWSVEIVSRSTGLSVSTSSLTLAPRSYSWAAQGGPLESTVLVAGDPTVCWDILNWLGHYVYLRNPNGTPVWWGIVQRAEVRFGSVSVGLSLDDMRNRILVDYTYDDASGSPQEGSTGWVQDDVSVGRFGKKEDRVSYADAKGVAEAQQKRDVWLDQVKTPVPSIEVGSEDFGGALSCIGLWQTLDWVFYENSLGREVYDGSDDIDHVLGWGLTSNVIGFRKEAIHDRDCRLGSLLSGSVKIRVSGSSSNDGVYTLQQVGEGPQLVLNSTHIYFTPNDDIRTTTPPDLFSFRADDMLLIAGSSAQNNGYWWVKTTGDASIEVTATGGILQDMSAGPSITLTQGHRLSVGENVTVERPGSNVTLSSLGTKLAQSFMNPQGNSWSLFEVMIKIKRVGTPVDYVRVSIYSGATPTTQIATTTVQGNSLPDESSWTTFTFGTPCTLGAGSTYWIVVERTGSNDPSAFYVVGLDSSKSYASGALKIWDSSWIDRWEDAEMPFQAWGQVETSSQMSSILLASGQFFSSAAVLTSSSTWKRQYRDGKRRALAEVEDLMSIGGSSGRRYISTVTPERMAIVSLEPLPSSSDPIYSPILGSLRSGGSSWDEGLLPVGQWVRLDDVPVEIGLSASGETRVFVERAEYDVESGRIQLEPRGRRLPWDL